MEDNKVMMANQLHFFFRRDPRTGRAELVQDVWKKQPIYINGTTVPNCAAAITTTTNNNNNYTVPASYVLPPLLRPRLTEVCYNLRPPLIDLSYNNTNNIHSQIRSACQAWGFMQIINHGVPQQIIESMWSAASWFFNLPSEQRARIYTADPRNIGAAHEAAATSSTLSWRETLRYRGVWDDSDQLPTFLREPLERYLATMSSLASRLHDMIMESLGVKVFDAHKVNISKKGVSMHIYPPCPQPHLTLGLGEHKDITTFTLLLETPDIGGFQLMKGNQWVDIKPTRGSLSLILGEQMERLSNGTYRAIKHRVVTNPNKLRMSIATFFLPPAHNKIQPLSHLTNSSNPTLLRGIAITDSLPLATSWFN